VNRSARPGGRTPLARLGLFGGTFDPPHLGHLALAEWAREALTLDRVVFMPAGSPPHKRAVRSPVEARLALVRLAVRGNPAFTVSTLEAKREGPSYTVDTLRALAASHPGTELWLLVGADMYATMHTWREIGAITRLAHVAVALRPGSARPRRAAWARGGLGVHGLDNPGIEISSSAVRDRARAGGSLRYLVPDAVARAIAARGLYRARGPATGARGRSAPRRSA
jgi:nicotinate-nucleotide adenylyltransferase